MASRKFICSSNNALRKVANISKWYTRFLYNF